MPRAVDPCIHDLIDRRLAGGNIFTGIIPVIAGSRDALAKSTAIQAGVRKIIFGCHIGRVRSGRIKQLRIPAQRRGSRICKRAAGTATRAKLINPRHQVLLKIGKSACLRSRQCGAGGKRCRGRVADRGGGSTRSCRGCACLRRGSRGFSGGTCRAGCTIKPRPKTRKIE